jgi:murein DD-endopeptidase MepM/ murein hydrolase activator NlpD
MRVLTASIMRARATETVARQTRGLSSTSFKEILSSLGESASEILSPSTIATPHPTSLQRPGNIVIQQGNCLARICSDYLNGQGGSVSQREIRAAVKEVAKANHIADPNKIRAGQTLDISALATLALGGENSQAAIVHEDAKPWRSLIEGTATLSSGFGLRKDPFTGQVHQHNGIDVAASAGASIHAVAAGSVVFSGWRPGYGNTVVIQHADGLESIYGHASKLLVHVGDQVACDTPIGCVGSTGRSTGAHLHFEVRRNGEAVNPINLLNGDLVNPVQVAARLG